MAIFFYWSGSDRDRSFRDVTRKEVIARQVFPVRRAKARKLPMCRALQSHKRRCPVTIIESLGPANKSFLNLLTDIHGTQPNARDLYSVGPDGSQRVLVPVGKDRYDLFISIRIPELTGLEK